MSDAGVTAAKALVNNTLALLDRLTPARRVISATVVSA